MLKVIIAVAGLILIGFIHFTWRDLPPGGTLELEFPEERFPAERKPLSEMKEISAGSRIYYPRNRRAFAVVLAADPAHEFPEGPTGPGVLVELKEGTRLWIRREQAQFLLVETTPR